MKQKTTFLKTMLLAAMLAVGGQAWATEDLTADLLFNLTSVGDGTVTGGTFETSGITKTSETAWTLSGTTPYVTINLSEPLKAGDIIEISGKSSESSKYFRFYNSTTFGSSHGGAEIGIGTSESVKQVVVAEPSTAANTLIGKSTIYMNYSSSGGSGTVNYIKVLKGTPDVISGTSKSWDFTGYTVNATATTYNMVHDQILFGKGVSVISMTDYKADESASASTCTLLNIPGNSGNLENGKYLMFRVQAGKTVVSMNVVTNGKSGSKTWGYKVGGNEAVTASQANKRSPATLSFNVYAGEETPVYIFCGDASNTFYIKDLTLTITPAPTISISTIDYATFSSSLALDFTSSGADAYIVTGEASGKLTYQQVTKVKAGTGLLLVGTAGSTCTPSVIADAEAIDYSTSNLLKPTLTATTVGTTEGADYGKVFVLGNKNSTLGFYKSNNGRVLTVGKAYLYLEGGVSSAREFYPFDFDNETTGLEDVISKDANIDGEYYNLAGQRVDKPTKGLYIVNGRKVVIK